jgi:hypothetical protein
MLGCVVAREVWEWALNHWDRLQWLSEVDTDLLQWWASRLCPKATQRDMWMAITLIFKGVGAVDRGRVVLFELEELPRLVGSIWPFFDVVSSM